MYEINYFPVAGLAEPIRLILAYCNIPFTQMFPKNWPAEKPTHLFKVLPCLNYKTKDGKQKSLYESMAIVRYLAKKHGLTSQDPEEEAFIDSIVNNLESVLQKIVQNAYADCPAEKKKEKFEKFKTDVWSQHLKMHAELIEKNGHPGFYFKEQTTYADIYLYMLVSLWGNDIGEPIPAAVQGVVDRIGNHPSIAKYLKSKLKFDYPLIKFWNDENAKNEFFQKMHSFDPEAWAKLP